jgi:hypothetical protein
VPRCKAPSGIREQPNARLDSDGRNIVEQVDLRRGTPQEHWRIGRTSRAVLLPWSIAAG